MDPDAAAGQKNEVSGRTIPLERDLASAAGSQLSSGRAHFFDKNTCLGLALQRTGPAFETSPVARESSTAAAVQPANAAGGCNAPACKP